MKAYSYIDTGRFEMLEKPKPTLLEESDAIVRVTYLFERYSHQARECAEGCPRYYSRA